MLQPAAGTGPIGVSTQQPGQAQSSTRHAAFTLVAQCSSQPAHAWRAAAACAVLHAVGDAVQPPSTCEPVAVPVTREWRHLVPPDCQQQHDTDSVFIVGTAISSHSATTQGVHLTPPLQQCLLNYAGACRRLRPRERLLLVNVSTALAVDALLGLERGSTWTRLEETEATAGVALGQAWSGSTADTVALPAALVAPRVTPSVLQLPRTHAWLVTQSVATALTETTKEVVSSTLLKALQSNPFIAIWSEAARNTESVAAAPCSSSPHAAECLAEWVTSKVWSARQHLLAMPHTPASESAVDATGAAAANTPSSATSPMLRQAVLQLQVPHTAVLGLPLPISLRLCTSLAHSNDTLPSALCNRPDSHLALALGIVTLRLRSSSGTTLASATLTLHRGVASGVLVLPVANGCPESGTVYVQAVATTAQPDEVTVPAAERLLYVQGCRSEDVGMLPAQQQAATLHVRPGDVLSIPAGSTLVLAPGAGIVVHTGGIMRSHGNWSHPVLLVGQAGDWLGIDVHGSATLPVANTPHCFVRATKNDLLAVVLAGTAHIHSRGRSRP